MLPTATNESISSSITVQSIGNNPDLINKTDVIEVGFHETADKSIGYLLILMSLVTVAGNIWALSFFWPIKHKSVHFKLYILIICVDIATGLSPIPIIVSLFHHREPMLFTNHLLCGVHITAVNFLIKYSMFLVAVLSVTRAVSVVRARKIRKISYFIVNLVVVGYAISVIFINLSFLAMGWLTTKYNVMTASCNTKKTETSDFWALAFYRVAVQIEILVPSITVFITFVIVITSLWRNRPHFSAESNTHALRRVRQVTITITLYTAIFLVCNTPVFLYYILQMLASYVPYFRAKLSGFLRDKTAWYGNLMIVYFPVVLNATLNPCLYLLRMPGYYAQFVNVSRQVSRKTSRLFMSQSRRGSQERSSERRGSGEPTLERRGSGEPILERRGSGEPILGRRGSKERVLERRGSGEPIVNQERRGSGEPIRMQGRRGSLERIQEGRGDHEPILERKGGGEPNRNKERRRSKERIHGRRGSLDRVQGRRGERRRGSEPVFKPGVGMEAPREADEEQVQQKESSEEIFKEVEL